MPATDIRPFRLEVPPAAIADLHARLERVRTCEPCKTSSDDRRPGHGGQF
jgi:hypothetical protein